MPFGELITGTRYFFANSVRSFPASESVAPWPMKITGRREACSRSSVAFTSSGDAPLRRSPKPSQAGSRSTSASSWNRLNGTSEVHRPGPAAVAVVIACRRASGSMSTRVGWKLRFTTGGSRLGKIRLVVAVQLRNGPRLNCEVGTFAVIARQRRESVCRRRAP